jgi:hypothetical protein
MAEMLLFFIPALMSLLDYGGLLRHDGWRILLVIGASTLMVMLVTAFTVELVCAEAVAMKLEWMPMFWLALTLLAYLFSRWIYRRTGRYLLSPLILVPALLLAVAVPLHTAYAEYASNTHWLMLVLGR